MYMHIVDGFQHKVHMYEGMNELYIFPQIVKTNFVFWHDRETILSSIRKLITLGPRSALNLSQFSRKCTRSSESHHQC
jgi:ligand-binding sensor domain-containing protein